MQFVYLTRGLAAFILILILGAFSAGADETTGSASVENAPAQSPLSSRQERIARWKELREKDPQVFEQKVRARKEEIKNRLQNFKENQPEKFEHFKQKSSEHRKARLQKLNRENPEKFRQVMQNRAQRFEAMKQNHPEQYQQFLQKHPGLSEKMQQREQDSQQRFQEFQKKSPEQKREFLQQHPKVQERIQNQNPNHAAGFPAQRFSENPQRKINPGSRFPESGKAPGQQGNFRKTEKPQNNPGKFRPERLNSLGVRNGPPQQVKQNGGGRPQGPGRHGPVREESKRPHG